MIEKAGPTEELAAAVSPPRDGYPAQAEGPVEPQQPQQAEPVLTKEHKVNWHINVLNDLVDFFAEHGVSRAEATHVIEPAIKTLRSL